MAKPTIRFKGYQDDWEQRKLGDVVEDYVEKTTVEDQYPVLTSSQRKGIVLQDDFFAGDRVNQNGNIGYFIIPRGYFAFRSRSDNDVFVFNRNDAVDMGIISYFYPVFKPRGVDSDFLLRRLNYGLEDQIKINSEGTGQHVLSLKKFKNMIGLFPSYEEQKKIGSYFSQIDHLITLHQRKCDETKRLKKYMLQKMFPQNGEKVPEIRFSGFTDDWEQRKLGDVAPLRGGYAFKSSEYKKDGTPIVRISNILPDGSIGADFACYDDMENDENISLRNGDALLAMSGATTGKVSILKCKNTDKYYQNQRVGYFKRNIQYNYDFVSTIVRSDLFKEQLMSVLVAGAQPNVSSKEIDSFEFVFPLNIEEQKKIGQYFANLDTLITLHQRELENLQNIKKFMLGKMFV
ncbi:restriction endonuclease subunit S [Gallintestinimicrobium propionicum]|uniref:Restriction endonuclease subunit S n=1 Tax=Gallintestinimicrobium propionicum TaxID=2981770 RepID=A0AAE3AR52_9FIRM|nr:restriction endonuclease subunit S [Gallintestinimicrobium propionicum]MCC2166273.1 restriction endonuclease subunit S [Gallintestinimicrobium propionicum]